MHCSKCGAVVPERAKFCTACGNPVVEAKLPATFGKRVWNYSLDVIFYYAIVFSASFTLGWFGILGGDTPDIIFYCISFGFLFGYYILFEFLWQRTPAKWITKTKVVRNDGGRPRFLQIVGRTFARFIPFDFLSFIGATPYGWHDQISGTIVVPTVYTPENVRIIDRDKHKSSSVAIVLIIIACLAFVGILASIVLVSLNSARQKGADLAVVSELSQARISAEIYWSGSSSYEGTCEDVQVVEKLSSAAQEGSGDPVNYGCYATKETYVMVAPLKSQGYYCVDNIPEVGTITSIEGGGTACRDFPGFQSNQ